VREVTCPADSEAPCAPRACTGGRSRGMRVPREMVGARSSRGRLCAPVPIYWTTRRPRKPQRLLLIFNIYEVARLLVSPPPASSMKGGHHRVWCHHILALLRTYRWRQPPPPASLPTGASLSILWMRAPPLAVGWALWYQWARAQGTLVTADIRHTLADDVEEEGSLDRLGDVVVHARRQAALAVAGHGGGGERGR